jgi:DNA-3-methyladenine glycosylase
MKLPRSFYLRPTLEVAPDLLGKYLVFQSPSGSLVGEINEVEAYMEEDAASHSFRGITERTKIMFEEGGYSYVYFIYGMYYCLNVTTEAKGRGAAVLIRSVIPREGIEIMQSNPGRSNTPKALTNGPGKICKAFGITKEQNGIDLVTSDELFIEDRGLRVPSFQVTPRIGISKATEKEWRFFYED